MQTTLFNGRRGPPEASNLLRRTGREAPSSYEDDTGHGDQTNGTDQAMMGRAAQSMRRRTSFRRTMKSSFRMFSKRSIFAGGESRCSHRGIQPCEQSLDDLDIYTDDEDEIKAPVFTTKRRPARKATAEPPAEPPAQPPAQPPTSRTATGATTTPASPNTEKEENTSITTRASSLAEGIPSVIYIVRDSFRAKADNRGLLNRIQNSLRNVKSKKQMLDESDEEAYDETLVEL